MLLSRYLLFTCKASRTGMAITGYRKYGLCREYGAPRGDLCGSSYNLKKVEAGSFSACQAISGPRRSKALRTQKWLWSQSSNPYKSEKRPNLPEKRPNMPVHLTYPYPGRIIPYKAVSTPYEAVQTRTQAVPSPHPARTCPYLPVPPRTS